MPAQFTNLLDVAIVLAAVYIALSTISSFINEQIATFLKLRGRKLFLGVANLVSSQTLANFIFAHPAIDPTVNDQGGIQDRPGEPNRPSYVAPHNFAVAFWDSLANVVDAAQPPTVRAANAVAAATAAAALAPSPATTARLQAANELQQMRAAATTARGTGVLSDRAHFEDLRQVVESLAIGHLKSNALQLLALGEEDYSKLLTATEAWFNRQMGAVEGWYTRQSRYIAIAIGVGIVFFTGLDTFEIAQRLYTAPAVVAEAAKSVLGAQGGANGAAQQTAVSNAGLDILKGNSFLQFFHPCLGLPSARPCLIGSNDAYISAPPVTGTAADMSACIRQLERHQLPRTLWATNCVRDQAQFDAALAADSELKQIILDDWKQLAAADAQLRADRAGSKEQQAKVPDDIKKVNDLRTKIDADIASEQKAAAALTSAQQSLAAYSPFTSHIVGWLITAFAISLGAPFWFDVLNRIVNVRNAGQKPKADAS